MYTLAITNGPGVILHDSIKEFPASLQLEAKQYTIMRSALATTPQELLQRKERMDLLFQFKQYQDYDTEAYNCQLAEQLMADEDYNLEHLEWACYLQSVNNEPVLDYSENALLERLTWLKDQGLTTTQISDSLTFIQERMATQIKRYYPSRLPKGKLNNLQRLQNYGVALAGHFEVNTEASQSKLDQTVLDLLSMQKPLNFRDAPDNVLVNLEKSQFKLYTTLQESGCHEPEKLTVFQFYNWIEVMEDRNEKQKSALLKMGVK